MSKSKTDIKPVRNLSTLHRAGGGGGGDPQKPDWDGVCRGGKNQKRQVELIFTLFQIMSNTNPEGMLANSNSGCTYSPTEGTRLCYVYLRVKWTLYFFINSETRVAFWQKPHSVS